jgi:transposase InsO family protein
MYQGGAIYVDHASKFITIQHQTSLSAADTVKGKLTFDRDTYTVGVILQQFPTDNGIFTSKEFMADLMDSEQSVRFSGVGAAHQNGSAERNIQTIVNMARTMMLHTALHSPSGFITADLWPMATTPLGYTTIYPPWKLVLRPLKSGVAAHNTVARFSLIATSGVAPSLFWNPSFKREASRYQNGHPEVAKESLLDSPSCTPRSLA